MKLKTLPLNQVKRGMRIFMRIDSNVPIVDGEVEKFSAWRIEQTLKDIELYKKKGAIIILAGHLGRPRGVKKTSFSLKPVANWYEEKLSAKILFIENITSKKSIKKVKKLEAGSIVMLENLRFYPNETFNCIWFSKRLSKYADVYINNAFGVCHRKHASIKNITKFLPSYAGSTLVNEVYNLSKKRLKPFDFVLGGIKLKTKMPTLLRLGTEADHILLGGGIAIALAGVKQDCIFQIMGQDIHWLERRLAKRILKKFGDKIMLPVDYIVERGDQMKNISLDEIGESDNIVDIGSETVKIYSLSLKKANSIVFNGAMGSLKNGAQKGTSGIAKALPVNEEKHSIVGGGDTVGFLENQKLLNHFNFVSTGGGSMLAFLAGQILPGLEVLKKK